MYLQHFLHVNQNLLVWWCRATLEICNDGRSLVDLGSEVFLCHCIAFIVLGLAASLFNGIADSCAHRLGLNDVVGAVDFCKVLAFGAGAL